MITANVTYAMAPNGVCDVFRDGLYFGMVNTHRTHYNVPGCIDEPYVCVTYDNGPEIMTTGAYLPESRVAEYVEKMARLEIRTF